MRECSVDVSHQGHNGHECLHTPYYQGLCDAMRKVCTLPVRPPLGSGLQTPACEGQGQRSSDLRPFSALCA
eukprot:1145462-Pelagomonas_calceolata.AAC.1